MTECKRSRDAATTREAILEAARECFTSRGYDQVGVREIAQKAGVTAALINRYFGTKEALFGEVLDYRDAANPDRDLSLQALLSQPASFGENLARRALIHRGDRPRFDPMLVILRSIGQPAAEAMLRDRLAIWLAPLATKIGGADAGIRAEMIVATLAGFDLMRNRIKSRALADADDERLIALLGAALQAQIMA